MQTKRNLKLQLKILWETAIFLIMREAKNLKHLENQNHQFISIEDLIKFSF